MWQVLWDSRAASDAERLDPQLRRRIIDGINRYAEIGQGDIQG